MRWGLLTSARCMAPDDGGASGDVPVVVDTPVVVALDAPETPAVADAVDAPASVVPPVDPEPKPKRTDRHIANLTRSLADERRLREAAELDARSARELLNANNPDAPKPAERPADIEARAAQLVAEREFGKRISDIDTAGKKEIGADEWEQAKATLTALGATGNQAFLQALAETENPAKIFAAMADDTDALADLLAKSPAAMAAKLGRMDAQLSKPAVRPLSAAPAPPAKIVPSGVVKDPDPYNYPANMSMKEWSKMMDGVLPPSLGGKRKVA